MELVIRILLFIGNVLSVIVNTLQNWFMPRQPPTYLPIRNKLLLKPIVELMVDLREKKITSEQLVQAYIARIREVNPSLNAVVDQRFEDALKDARLADRMIAKANAQQLIVLFMRYPMLGVPCTIKESCGLKGLSFTVGSVHRTQTKCPQDGDVVELLRAAGCIPLLVSATSEFCMAFETNTHVNGRCRNPYDLNRVSAGSSGGEGSLNGAGATLFGLGSDIGGSIRLPALFCGVFGHKPTAELTSVQGHFPSSANDPEFGKVLQLGPMTRFARDLPLLLQVMAGSNVEKLKFGEGKPLKDIKIYYAFGFDGLNGWLHPPIAFDIKLAIIRAVKCFEKEKLMTKEVKIKGFRNSLEIMLKSLVNLKGTPSIVTQSATNRLASSAVLKYFLSSLCGRSKYTKESLLMEWMQQEKAYISEHSFAQLDREKAALKAELVQLLGTDGVLFFPTFHTPAFGFNTSILNLVGVDYLGIFNVLGLPATHIPMGLDHRGMPIGFQVIAAPYQDKLCLQIAVELEGAFGGWVPPLRNEIET